MSQETVTLFFALLAVATAIGLVALGGILAWSRMTGRSSEALAPVRAASLELAAAVAVVCTLGSLYLSEVANFDPCFLCWVQRGFMYPAAVILLAAVVTRRASLAYAGGALALLGLPVAVFHRVEQAVGELGTVCDAANPCSARWVQELGFITIPTMAAVGFAAVASLVALHVATNRSSTPSGDAVPGSPRSGVSA